MAKGPAIVKNEIGTVVVAVIPTLDAATSLPATLDALAAIAVVVVDGRSGDSTVAVARRGGARVIEAARGRGGQIRAGIAATSAPWLLLLHADTVLAPHWPTVVADFIRQHPHQAGYFRFRLDSADPHARRLERLVAWRCRRLGLPYGDQGLLLSRALLDQVGGMRALPLMEDVDLARRLSGRLLPLDCDATTSAVRWQRGGWLRRSLRNLVCLALWYAGVPPIVIARLYR